QIQLEFNEAITTSITATVYDMHGQLIYSKIIHDQTSNINELRNAASGIYYLHLSGENGQINTYKLIKL
ncbi:MAG: T9SS type A sorting domain-containing protein, partial [Bacteroidales bacterium]|nr:T9SS type A sorting domain-containing protein [Bacteroidales bacterium]